MLLNISFLFCLTSEGKLLEHIHKLLDSCCSNSLFRAPEYPDTHSFGMLFVNAVTITGNTFRTALPI